MLKFHTTGRWLPGQVHLHWAPSTHRSTPHIEQLIERAWGEAKYRLGDKLFDGPMCRLERWSVDAADPRSSPPQPSELTLSLSLTSYRIFLGTNMSHPELADTDGPEVMANPVGVSTALITADNHFMLGRRSGHVAYYPHMLHPFAGSLEPPDDDPLSGGAGVRPAADLFAEARRELHEELGLTGDLVTDLSCLGIVEDLRLRHPEAILSARTSLTRSDIQKGLLGHEHVGAWSCPATSDALSRALADRSAFTPVAHAAIELVKLAAESRGI